MMEIFREILAAYGGVHLEDIRGMRAPFLAIGVFIFILIYQDLTMTTTMLMLMTMTILVITLLYDSGESHVFNATRCQLHI